MVPRARGSRIGVRHAAAPAWHLGIRGNVSRSARVDVNERRGGRIDFEFAQALIRNARHPYAKEPLGVELSQTV